ncbi:hypothetical protein B0J14DRAFT_585670 [Halenospora varia]|nr:hypothetical protein B0J14DRAFT_585670 [Halenospora varia]
MAIRYTPDELIYLRDSPLVVKPPGLPPAEQWMGTAADTSRNSTKSANDRDKNYDSNLNSDQPNRRPVAERHVSRNSANPEDIILGPPKTSFMSATSRGLGSKAFDSADRSSTRDLDSRDRYNFRSSRTGDGDNDRLREGRNNNLRVRRTEGGDDSDGWSTVKPRKSFGNEGAERFNGRMGLDRSKDERRFKDRDDRDTKERPSRGFDTFSRDKDGDDQERDSRRNGTGRGRNEPSWFKDNADGPPTPRDRNSNGDRFMDRSRGWREKEREDRGDRGDRGDRRWDRDREQRQEREPEWLAEPEEEKSQAHTQEDFQKWKEQMAGKDKSASNKVPTEEASKPDTGGGFFGLESTKVETPLAIDTGPDKFFGKWAAPKEEVSPESGSGVESKMEGAGKPKASGKASRFTSFFAPQEEPQRRQTEPPPAMPPPASDLSALFQSPSQSAEKEAFQQLLQKLQRQTVSGTGSTPPANILMQPKPPAPEKLQNNPIHSPEPFQQYRTERQDEGRPSASTRNSQQTIQDLLAQRQVAGSQPTIRPEQMLQELVGQRQNALSQSSVRPDQAQGRNNNTEFLMGLMQSAKAAPEPQRSEQVLLRMAPKSANMDRHLQQQMMEREQELQREAAQRERSASQRQPRPQPPPGFYDDPTFQRGGPPHERQGGNPTQPTQILQRPPPPGLDVGWDRPVQLPPPQHRINQNIQPPPGLASGPNRSMPIPQNMFPPGFPMANFPPDMPGPPRNMPMQPPPGFFNPPPPGFLPPGMSGFQGPEGMAFGGPYDGRGPPPQGAFRRQ